MYGVIYIDLVSLAPFPGLTKSDLLQLTASFDANMLALRNRTLAAGKFAWQLMGSARVRAPPVSSTTDCKADLAGYCQAEAQVQHEAMHYMLGKASGSATPRAPFTNCTASTCTLYNPAFGASLNCNYIIILVNAHFIIQLLAQP